MRLINQHQIRRRNHVRRLGIDRLDPCKCHLPVKSLLPKACAVKTQINTGHHRYKFFSVLGQQLLDVGQHQNSRARILQCVINQLGNDQAFTCSSGRNNDRIVAALALPVIIKPVNCGLLVVSELKFHSGTHICSISLLLPSLRITSPSSVTYSTKSGLASCISHGIA